MYKSHQQKASKITQFESWYCSIVAHRMKMEQTVQQKLIATMKTSLPGCPQLAANDGDSCEHHHHIPCLKITSHAMAASVWKYDGSHMD